MMSWIQQTYLKQVWPIIPTYDDTSRGNLKAGSFVDLSVMLSRQYREQSATLRFLCGHTVPDLTTNTNCKTTKNEQKEEKHLFIPLNAETEESAIMKQKASNVDSR